MRQPRKPTDKPQPADEQAYLVADLVELTHDSVIVMNWDGTIVFWNRGAEERYGWNRKEALGKKMHKLLKTETPSTLEKIKAALLGTGQWEGELVHTKSDGARIVVDGRLALRRDEKGNPEYILEINSEVKERSHALEELRRSEARLAGIISSAMDAIITVDDEQRITVFNAAAEEMFRCVAADALGQSLDRFIPDRHRQVHREHIRSFGQSGVTARSMTSPALLTALRSDGEEFPIEATISQVEVAGKKLFTVILRDITERTRHEEQLIAQQETIRQLSFPVLRVRDKLLIAPIIGALDNRRVRQLIEQLLDSIRAHRAKSVVLDLTGVPTVDTAVANSLMDAINTSRLLGASVIVTGLSLAISEVLVNIGLDMSEIITAVDLQSGIEMAERFVVRN